MVSSLGTDPKPAFTFPPREGLPHLSPSPLLPPTAVWENSCLPLHTSLTAPSGRLEFCCSSRDLGGNTVPTTGAHTFPGAFQARTGARKAEEGAPDTASTDGLVAWRILAGGGLVHPDWLPPNAANLSTDPPGAPWCPTGGCEAPQLVFRIWPGEPNFFLPSFQA